MSENQAELSPVTRHFVAQMVDLAGTGDASLVWAAAAVAEATLRQHACIELSALAGTPVPQAPASTYPPLSVWLQALRVSDTPVGLPGAYQPLILDDTRLYLQRYWHYETTLAAELRARAALEYPVSTTLSSAFQQAFVPGAEPDWQALAAASALLNGLTLIAGGPGTGKTTTTARILRVLLAQEPTARVVLAAPTGKAAARMQQALERSLRPDDTALQTLLAQEPLTLHRLLGYRPGSHLFEYGPEHPLPWDVVVIDEASMIDLALMCKLVQAVHPSARLILLGDADQLASVEAGCVLGDMCRAARPEAFSPQRQQQLRQLTGYSGALPLSAHTWDDRVIHLQVSHRFSAAGGIGALARQVNAGHAADALAVLAQQEQVALEPFPDELETALTQLLHERYRAYLTAESPEAALAQFEDHILLCPLRQGPAGTHTLNQAMESALKQYRQAHRPEPWYHLRPVLITRNDYTQGLYNGDIGVVWRPSAERPRVWFRQRQGWLSLNPAQLGAHETAWALTVHKSQGSEFQHVTLLLPPEPHPLLTRELIYTGLTRARHGLRIWGSAEVLTRAIECRIQRHSGLSERLTQASGATTSPLSSSR